MTEWWSWLLFALGAFGLWLSFEKPKVGPWFNIVGQTVWFTYGFMTHQYGFLVSSFVYAAVFARVLWKAHHPKMTVDTTPTSG